MRELIVKDDGELRRIERAIAEFEARQPAERLRRTALLDALRRQRADLLRCHPRVRRNLVQTAHRVERSSRDLRQSL